MTTERAYGRYVLEERIAMGGMAEIFRARTATEGFEKTVCIKRVLPHFLESPDFVTMFRDEARLAAKLQHANVVQVFDFGEAEGTLYLAMELVDGADLKKLIDRSTRSGLPFSIGQAVQIAIEMARGLHHAHTLIDGGEPLRLVHRDISPHNILISRAGEVKVTDFGIAKAEQRASHTSTGVVKGKLSYMAPEQADGSTIDQRVDQFATAIVLWETLCGRKLFDGDNEAQVLRKVLTCEIPRPSAVRGDIPAGVDDVVLKALSPSPDERYEDMRHFERALTKSIFDLSDDPGFTDLRPLVSKLLEDGANMRRTAVLEAPEAAAVAPILSDDSGVFTSNSDARAALQRAGLAAEESAETVMADQTVLASPTFDDDEAQRLSDSTEPTRTHVPAETLAEEHPQPADLSSQGTDAERAGFQRTDSGDFSAASNPPAAFPRRSDPEAVIPTERMGRAPGARSAHSSALPLIGGLIVVLLVVLIGVIFTSINSPLAEAAPTAHEVTADPANPATGLVVPKSTERVSRPTTLAARSERAKAEPERVASAQLQPRDETSPKVAQSGDPEPGQGGEHQPPGPSKIDDGQVAAPRKGDAPRRKPELARKPASKARTTARASTTSGTGKVFVNVLGSWAHVYEGKRKLGTTPATLRLSSGPHKLRLENPETGRKQTLRVRVNKDALSKLIARW